MSFATFIEWCLEHLNYFTITLLMIIESSFIPFPSEVVIPPAAYKAASAGEMNVVLVVLFGTLGAIIGAMINYYLALWLGRPIIHRFANSRLGAMLLLSEESVVKAERFFARHGKISTLIGRLVPGVRQLISIPAGLARMPLLPFVFFTAIGATIWNVVLAAIGWYLEGFVPEPQLMEYVYRYSKPLGYTIMALVVVALIVIAIRAYKRPATRS